MSESDDIQLLRECAERQSETAFGELVRRHVNLVYSVALRQTGNPHAAEEITQAVFIILARKAGSLGRRTILSAWLYQTARLTAANFLRTERRRAHREQEAYMQSLSNEPGPDVWPQIAPLLDDALGKLGEKDRHAIVLRFFESKSLAEVGAALGASEDAAKMRVNRALEKLRRFFAKRGVHLGASGIAVAISANAVQAAPIGLTVTISTVAGLAGATIAATAKTIAMTTMQKSLIAATLAIVTGAGIYEARQASRLRDENAALRGQTSQLAELDQLRADKQRLAEQLQTELARPQSEHEELLRLRGQVGALRAPEQENARLKTERNALAKRIEEELAKLPEEDPGFRTRRDKMSYLGNWGLALKVYARTNNGRLPTSLAEAAPSMPNADTFFKSLGAAFRDDQFEMACQGSLTNLTEPERIIVVREKETVRVSNGKSARAYLFADGHTEIHFAADGEFTSWEQEHLPPKSNP